VYPNEHGASIFRPRVWQHLVCSRSHGEVEEVGYQKGSVGICQSSRTSERLLSRCCIICLTVNDFQQDLNPPPRALLWQHRGCGQGLAEDSHRDGDKI